MGIRTLAFGIAQKPARGAVVLTASSGSTARVTAWRKRRDSADFSSVLNSGGISGIGASLAWAASRWCWMAHAEHAEVELNTVHQVAPEEELLSSSSSKTSHR